MTRVDTDHDRNADRDAIAELHTRWLFGWDREPSAPPFEFRRTFADFYDFDGAGGRFYDDFDPEHRVADSPDGYGAIWQPTFRQVRRARHEVDSPADVLLGSGDLAASSLVFLARIEGLDGTLTDIRTTTSLVWRYSARGWRIAREHNSTVVLPGGALDDRFPVTTGA
jgi:ketosteroid isomerase-like protein